MKNTKSERIINYLIARGCKEIIPSKSKKYRQFTFSDNRENMYYWIGKNGAVRYGKNSSASFSMSYRFSKI